MEIKTWIESLDRDIITVIIPTYNRHNFLSAALHSLAKCELGKKLEIIVVEDGSDEFTSSSNVSLLNSLSKNWANTQYVRLHINSGTVTIPRNVGISYANGAILSHTDDDCLPKKRKFIISEELKEASTILVYGDREEYSADTNGDFHYYRTVSCPQYESHKKSVGIDNGQFLYKAEVYDHVKPNFSINACDWELYSSFADYGNFKYINLPVCKYLWHATNISRTPKQFRKKPLELLGNFLDSFKEGYFKNECANLLSAKSNG